MNREKTVLQENRRQAGPGEEIDVVRWLDHAPALETGPPGRQSGRVWSGDDDMTAAGQPFVLPGFSSAGDSRSTVVAPYFVDQIALSERLQLLAGVRWDSIDFEDAVTGISRSQSELSPMLGLVFRAADTLSLYANAGRSFAPRRPRLWPRGRR